MTHCTLQYIHHYGITELKQYSPRHPRSVQATLMRAELTASGVV